MLKYGKADRILLKAHPDFTEKWVQDRISEDPTLLGLGEVVVKDKERIHSGAGRLDLLLQDPETLHRYEVELQLGKTDESHVIRTIEYWDIERKRYPQYEHTAVLIAEDITSRFLNVVALFNGFIPLVAIQMQALRFGDQVTLAFITILGEMRLGLVDEDEVFIEPADRSYWEKRSTKQVMSVLDDMMEIVRTLDSNLTPNYTKSYVGVLRSGQPDNFVVFRPRKDGLRVQPRLEQSDETDAKLEELGLDVVDYSTRRGRYRIRLVSGDTEKHKDGLQDLLHAAYDQSG